MKIQSLLSITCFCMLVFLLPSCKDTNSMNGYEDLDLLSHGIPIKIKAPAGAEIKVDDMGIVKDITVRADDSFSLQIIEGTSYLANLSEVVSKQKADAIASRTFSEIVEEDDHGFIFQKKYSEDRSSYDFRYVRLQGDKEYIFQTGLLGQYTLEQVKEMYKAVQ